jgi:hypothetical protein
VLSDSALLSGSAAWLSASAGLVAATALADVASCLGLSDVRLSASSNHIEQSNSATAVDPSLPILPEG